MECIFCQELDSRDLIYETKRWNVFLSWDQTYLGRSIVVLKRHCENLTNLNKLEWEEFAELIKKLESGLRKSFNPKMFNWGCLMNDAYKSKNPSHHVHWHVRPRYNHKTEIKSIVFEDLEFGHHYIRKQKREVSKEVRKIINDKIKGKL